VHARDEQGQVMSGATHRNAAGSPAKTLARRLRSRCSPMQGRARGSASRGRSRSPADTGRHSGSSEAAGSRARVRLDRCARRIGTINTPSSLRRIFGDPRNPGCGTNGTASSKRSWPDSSSPCDPADGSAEPPRGAAHASGPWTSWSKQDAAAAPVRVVSAAAAITAPLCADPKMAEPVSSAWIGRS
jgi:hypothetical protein